MTKIIKMSDKLPPVGKEVWCWLEQDSRWVIDELREQSPSDGGGFEFINGYIKNYTYWADGLPFIIPGSATDNAVAYKMYEQWTVERLEAGKALSDALDDLEAAEENLRNERAANIALQKHYTKLRKLAVAVVPDNEPPTAAAVAALRAHLTDTADVIGGAF